MMLLVLIGKSTVLAISRQYSVLLKNSEWKMFGIQYVNVSNFYSKFSLRPSPNRKKKFDCFTIKPGKISLSFNR